MLFLPLLLAFAAFNPPRQAVETDILARNLDPSVDPGVDFFIYANGGWLKRNPIPSTESSWGIYHLVRDEIYEKLRSIDERYTGAKFAPGTSEQKIGDFWATAMDEAKAETAGLSPLKSELDRLHAIATVRDAIGAAFELKRLGVESFFSLEVSQDEKDSTSMALHLGQGGLGLPDRDYYVKTDPEFAKIRREYVAYVRQVLALTGQPVADADATNVLDFETGLARVSRTMEGLNDPIENYHKLATAEVRRTLTPSIAWEDQLGRWKIHPASLIVGQPEFLGGLEALLTKTPVATLRDYLRFHLIDQFAPYLNKAADQLDFHFRHQILSGQQDPRPRWKRAMEAQDEAIGFVVGRIFVKETFPPAAKKRYSELVEALRRAFGRRIDRLDWMSPETKVKAKRKLAVLRKKVGYPDKWKDYSALPIGRASYCENMMSAFRWKFDDALAKLGKPVDHDEWSMTPQTFNAYYDPSNNEIVVPAANFIIPGLRDSEVDDALAYGYFAASTMGHEMTHGFDDSGRQFDAKGNLADWWTKADAAEFKKRAGVLVAQFNAYEPLPGIHINGSASIDENIADFGGLLLGMDAFKQTAAYRSGSKIAGLTPAQRFYLGYALSWLDEMREAALRRQLASDVHAPPKWRVNGPLSNMPDFYAAFGIKEGQPMWRPPAARASIW